MKDREAPFVELLSCDHNALEGLSAGPGASAEPRGDAAGEDALSGASVKCIHGGGWAVALLWNSDGLKDHLVISTLGDVYCK